MAERLTEITTHYHTFVDNQVLTKDQLNQFINYFEDQDRLSRVFLHGVGIVCGFKLGFNSGESKIIISQGVGITTDGDLIQLRKSIPETPFKSVDLDKIEYTQYKKFEDSFADYPFFKKTDGGEEKPMDLWEVFPEEMENSKPLGDLPNLNNKVVLLYLESFAKEGDLCTTTNCDNQGVEQVFRLHVLLVSKEDAEIIAGKDSIFSKHNIADKYYNLPDISVRRVVLNEVNSSAYEELKQAYRKALSDGQLLPNLENGITSLVNNFGPVLQLEDVNLNSVLTQLKKIMVLNSYNVPFNVQYRYDCVKDIADTWNEIKALLLELKEECCPDINAFPKHLLLGNLDEINSDVKHNRHRFYKSPIASNHSEKIKECRNLVVRMFEIISNFQTKPGDVKITPSNKLTSLSYRAVPFYYDVNPDLLKSWNYCKTEKNEQRNNLSYHTDQLASLPAVQEPLAFNIDKFDFYRIEGHQGKDYRRAMAEIDGLKRKYGLAFDIKALSVNINTENLNIDDYECEFEDLQVMLHAWTAEQECILGEISGFFSGFSLKDPGTNVAESAIDLSHVAEVSAANRFLNSNAGNERIISNIKEGAGFKTNYSYYQPYSYKTNTVVTDNLITDENALGSIMKVAFEESKGGSVNDIIAKAGEKVEKELDAEIWKENPEIKDLVINNSIELMANAEILIQRMPGSISAIDVTSVNNYKLTLSALCKLVKKLRTRYQSVQLSAALKSYTDLLIMQLSSVCCSAKKLEIVQEEVNKRKESILLRLQLSKFVEKHPGLEHKAGVEPGGTFILVYLNKKESSGQETTNIRDITEGRNIVELAEARNFSSGFSIRTNQPVEIKEAASIRDRNIINEIRGADLASELKLLDKFVKVTDLPNNTVVADFALPYMCCSDCAPVNFIIPKTPVSLRLETDRFCLGKDKGPLIFDVSPEDGVIKSDPEIAGVAIDDNKLIIDENNFPEEMIGQPISFTVNDQITDVKLTVYKGVDFDFEVPESPTTQTEITFTPAGNLEGASFLWSFGDDNMSTERNPTHRYSLPVNDENKVVVSLTVTAANGVCTSTVEHEIAFEIEEVEVRIALEKKDYCENDQSSYPFKILPEGAKPTIKGEGVQQTSDGGFVFIPAAAGSGQHSFKVNENPSGVTVTVHNAPVAKFEPRQVDNQLVITNNSTNADSFVWVLNGETIERNDTSQVVRDLTPNSPTTWLIQLTAVSRLCGNNSTEMNFTVEIITEEPACVDEAKIAIHNDMKELAGSNVPTSNFVVPIWKATSEIYGGTPDFNGGVLDDADNFLDGKNNEKLPEMFPRLLQQTAQMIAEMRDRSPEEAKVLTTLFDLQLRLFYNILGCQGREVIEASADNLKQVLDMIIELLHFAKSSEVILSDNLRDFIQTVAEKLKAIPVMNEHFSTIKEGNLI